ncbi:DUF7472 family protein [Natronorubrum halophilum]|uniref:DUF7472 family protein n=1 Tax=Natronorubrum halophilum TaxID=1702106 RepID=UPI000EF6F079|nr:hypothetical protein [Natronorubrum halophilum]
MLDRDQIIEIAVAVASVLLMLSAMFGIGSQYGTDNGTLSPEGGEMLVIAIIGFILLLTTVGLVLAFLMNEPEDELEPDDDADAKSAV